MVAVMEETNKMIEAYTTAKGFSLHEVTEMIAKYNKNVLMLISFRKDRTIAPAIAQHGIQASMPKGKGGTSDPVLREVERLNEKTPLEEKVDKKVGFIQSFLEYEKAYELLSLEEAFVFEATLNGAKQREIASEIDVSLTFVQDKLQRVAEIITEKQGEF